jgi:hypothetical protein
MEKVSLLSGAKFSGKSETPKTSSTPKLEDLDWSDFPDKLKGLD